MPDDSSPSLLSSGVGSDEFRRKLGILIRGRARCFSVIVRCSVSVTSMRKTTSSWSLHSRVNHLSWHSTAAQWINQKYLTRTLSTIEKSKNVPLRAVQNFLAFRLPLSQINSDLRSPTFLNCRGDIFQTGYTLILFS